MAGGALKARASTPLARHQLREGNLDVVLLESVPSVYAQSFDHSTLIRTLLAKCA